MTRFSPARSQNPEARIQHLENSLARLQSELRALLVGQQQVSGGYAGRASGEGQIGETQIAWDISDGHNHDGIESRVVDLAGDVTGNNTAALVAQIQGVPVADPAVGDDGQFARYNHGTPNITWETPAGPVWAIATKTGNYTVTDSDWMILVDATAGAVVITLHAVATAHKHPYTIKKIDASANTVTIDGNGAETIDDAPTQVIATQYEALSLHPDGTEWWIG